ncbi:uncharacterized protein LOC141851323 [Brevipalpus obovatus]|uniref:uncharacterized protein LOC141851323 n=1 Tax=Brevipalpus obovatus TaxID=246614 RepID=UPI003D9F6849
MQSEGKPRFLQNHSKEVKGVAFSPKDRHLFCSGGNDGKINIYNAHDASVHNLLLSFKLASPNTGRHITGIRFTPDGQKILATAASRRLAVLDVERGNQIQCYENCAYQGRERIALACDPTNPNLAACNCSNGRSVALLDTRMPTVREFLFDLHTSTIRDITFLNHSWPFVKSDGSGLVSLSHEGVCKITTLQGETLHTFSVGHNANTIAATPEDFGSMSNNGFKSHILIGGDSMSCYTPENGPHEKHSKLYSTNPSLMWKLKYTTNGCFLYAACEGGKVKRYRRYPNEHKYIGDVIMHKADVYDLDISPYDEYLVTASKDCTVGVLNLGAPNRGWSSYFELT